MYAAARSLLIARFAFLLSVCTVATTGASSSVVAQAAPATVAHSMTLSTARNVGESDAILHSFGSPSDGAFPFAGLTARDGMLYGTTVNGGAGGQGTVFKITTTGAETVLHQFGGGVDGAQPYAAPIVVNGDLYGTTVAGGPRGYGTVFKIGASGTESVLYRFTGGKDGSAPLGRLVSVGETLYGTTEFGGGGGCGGNGCGTAFAVTLAGEEHVVRRFQGGLGGEFPTAGLVAVNGVLYGTTRSGGSVGDGIAFKLTTSGTESVLHNFAGGRDGAYPAGGLTPIGDALYGTTDDGGGGCDCGIVFDVSTSGDERVLHRFSGGSDGGHPTAELLAVGTMLYGTTDVGGSGACGCGTVFKISAGGEETVLYRFKGSPDGATPYAGVSAVGGALYGTTYRGGTNAAGAVFSFPL